jgi:hypothetical protein
MELRLINWDEMVDDIGVGGNEFNGQGYMKWSETLE